MKRYPRIPPDDKRCSRDNVSDGTGWHFFRCKRRGVVEEGDQLWCKQHSPSSVKARQEARAARYKAQSDARRAPYHKIERLEAINTDLLAALKQILRGEPCGEQGCKHGVPLACAIHIADDAIAKAELPA